jgi:hypothetical protein
MPVSSSRAPPWTLKSRVGLGPCGVTVTAPPPSRDTQVSPVTLMGAARTNARPPFISTGYRTLYLLKASAAAATAERSVHGRAEHGSGVLASSVCSTGMLERLENHWREALTVDRLSPFPTLPL